LEIPAYLVGTKARASEITRAQIGQWLVIHKERVFGAGTGEAGAAATKDIAMMQIKAMNTFRGSNLMLKCSMMIIRIKGYIKL
jgi:hypothetical protein